MGLDLRRCVCGGSVTVRQTGEDKFLVECICCPRKTDSLSLEAAINEWNKMCESGDLVMADCRNVARQRFESLGIEYGQIYEGDIEALFMLVNRAVKRFVSEPPVKDSISTMHMSRRVKINKRTNGTIRDAHLFVNSYYFTQREAISFNSNGFIGFAGWASDNNVQPFIEGFMEWCDYMEGRDA